MRLINYNLTVVFFLFTQMGIAQFANNWYFGSYAGLTFNTTPPTALTGGQINNVDNSSAISDANGNLLFYTDGSTVWTKTHTVMPNGSGLIGNYSAGQCAVIVPIPCSSTQYVIFHVTEFSNPGYLHYTVVDMTLNGGFGDVVSSQKNVSLGSGWTEKLCAYYNAAANSYWVLTHKWNSDQFVAFEVTSTNIAVNSATSAVGSVHNCGSYGAAHDGIGQLTISPDGTRVLNALTCQDKFELFNFNVSTGTLSNPISIPGYQGSALGTAFSPNSTKIYGSSVFGTTVFQYDISSYNQTSIIASQYSVVTASSGGYNFLYMELGPDGKLYIAKPSANYVSVINNPNISGASCNFSLTGPGLGSNTCVYGLNRIAYNIPSSVINLMTTCSSSLLCAGASATLTVSGANTYTWLSVGTGSSIIVTPQVSTNYTVNGTSACSAGTGSAIITVSVAANPTISITGASVICRGQTASLSALGASSYTWSTGQTTSGMTVSPTTNTTYTVTGANSQGCTDQAALTVSVNICEGIIDKTASVPVSFYPNPVKQTLYLSSPDNWGWSEIQIFDMTGKVVCEQIETPPAGTILSMDIGKLPAGLYFLKGKYDHKPVSFKLQKE